MNQTCFSLPYVGDRELSPEEVSGLRSRVRSRLLTHFLVPLIVIMTFLFGMLALSNAQDTFWFVVFTVLTALALLSWDRNRIYIRAMRAGIRTRIVHRFEGYLAGSVVLEEDPVGAESVNGRVFEANLEIECLPDRALSLTPEINQSIELFPGSRLIYSVNGTVTLGPCDAAPDLGKELPRSTHT